MLKYIIFSIVFVIFVYINDLGIMKGFKDVPEGEYKDFVRKYKRIEILEKAVICAIFVFMITSMGWTDEIALIALIGMAAIMTIEYFFGKYMRKSFVCIQCGESLWTGNYIVMIRCRKICPHCNHILYTIETSEEHNKIEE